MPCLPWKEHINSPFSRLRFVSLLAHRSEKATARAGLFGERLTVR
jgi:hypothetical protein